MTSVKSSPSIRSIARALQLLRLINERQGMGLQGIHALSGLPKPTVFRILQTLRQEGYLEPDGMPGVYHVTPKALELSNGYTEKSLLVKLAAPIALATTKQIIKWPLAIGTLDHGAIVVRYSTMPYSPLGVVNTTIGHRHDLLDSAMGRAYLRACDVVERQNLLLLIQSMSSRPAAELQAKYDAVLADAQIGYGLRLARKNGDSATLAVALRHAGEVLAVLSLTSFGKTMNAEFIAKLLPTLRATAATIEAAYAAAVAHSDSLQPGALQPE